MSDLNIKLGKYTLHEVLGSGAFGTVYRATDLAGQVVAVKELKPTLLGDMPARTHFEREAHEASRLDHPSIAKVLEFDESDGRVFFAMQYIEGKSLNKVLSEKKALTLLDALKIFSDVADALDYAHSCGLIHRDIKPSNIMVGLNGAVLTDFGLVKIVSSSGITDTITADRFGTASYTPPEIWLNKQPTPQTDIYALGCVLYEMLTGKVLFFGDTDPAIMKKHFDKPLVFPKRLPVTVPHETEIILREMLEKNPDERPHSARSCVDKLINLSDLLAPTDNEKVWAIISHVSSATGMFMAWSSFGVLVPLGFVLPLLIWQTSQAVYVRQQAFQALIFYLACSVLWFITLLVGALLSATVVLSWVVFVAYFVLPSVQIIWSLYGAYCCYRGRRFRYPWIADWAGIPKV